MFPCPLVYVLRVVPTEYSSGQITRRGHITKAGPQGVRTALVEAAWHYRHTPKVGVGLARRHSDLSAATVARSPTARAPPEHQVPPDAGSRQGTQRRGDRGRP